MQTQQLAAALQAIEKFANEQVGPDGVGPCVVLGGDFNAKPDSATYELLTKGVIDTARCPTVRVWVEMMLTIRPALYTCCPKAPHGCRLHALSIAEAI